MDNGTWLLHVKASNDTPGAEDSRSLRPVSGEDSAGEGFTSAIGLSNTYGGGRRVDGRGARISGGVRRWVSQVLAEADIEEMNWFAHARVTRVDYAMKIFLTLTYD